MHVQKESSLFRPSTLFCYSVCLLIDYLPFSQWAAKPSVACPWNEGWDCRGWWNINPTGLADVDGRRQECDGTVVCLRKNCSQYCLWCHRSALGSVWAFHQHPFMTEMGEGHCLSNLWFIKAEPWACYMGEINPVNLENMFLGPHNLII